MAFLEQTATDLNDILAKANTFFAANGWTITLFDDDASKYSGDVFTGKRLHLSKTLSTDAGNVGVFVNLRSANNQNVYAYGGTNAAYRITGIACNMSNSFNGALAWDVQPNSTSAFSASSVAGCAHLRKTSVIKCHFFSGNHSGAIAMEGTDQWYTVLFGVTNLGVPFYACSGGLTPNSDTYAYKISKAFLFGSDLQNTDVYYAFQLWKAELGKWVASFANGWNLPSMRNTSAGAPYLIVGYLRNTILATPDVYTGNPLLLPSEFVSTDSTTTYTPVVPMGHCPDVALINTKFLVDESVVEVGSEDWVCYRVNKDATFGNVEFGYAIRK